MKLNLKSSFAALVFALVSSVLAPNLHAAEALTSFQDSPDVQEFITKMHEQYNFDVDSLQRDFASVSPNSAVLRAIRPPASPATQRSWQRYRARFLNATQTRNGLKFWQKNIAELERAAEIYGIPPEIIVAIIGIETAYGQNMGQFSVLEALATLAFDYPPRAEFFRSELEAFFLLARENGYDPLDYQGSYAGAIGIPQFMPSSLRQYAVDFDGDGRIELRDSPSDAIGSVARFLKLHGWQNGAPIALPAQVEGDPSELIAAGIKPSEALKNLVGVTSDGDPELPAALIDLVTPKKATEYWVGFNNFYVITRYNRSSFYAMSVYQVAQSLRETKP